MAFNHEAGKGSAPRKAQDQEKYSEGYDRIFGKNKEKVKEVNKRMCPNTYYECSRNCRDETCKDFVDAYGIKEEK